MPARLTGFGGMFCFPTSTGSRPQAPLWPWPSHPASASPRVEGIPRLPNPVITPRETDPSFLHNLHCSSGLTVASQLEASGQITGSRASAALVGVQVPAQAGGTARSGCSR